MCGYFLKNAIRNKTVKNIDNELNDYKNIINLKDMKKAVLKIIRLRINIVSIFL